MKIYCLRVDRNVAGRAFPFDRVYLTKYNDRDVIERLFRYALVMPAEGRLMDQLTSLPIDEVVARPFNRDDSATLDKSSWEQGLANNEWVLAVPLLPKWIHKNMPQYLTAERWFEGTKRRRRSKYSTTAPKTGAVRSPFESRAYLQTPQKKIRPICVACPRAILQDRKSTRLNSSHT